MPKISVLMPIYNTNLKHLKVAISSILSQTFKDFEFLILNDFPENTELDRIVEHFNDPRIKYIKSTSNLGIAEAHNKLLKEAKGEYIALMDHDDISLPQRLEKQYNYMENHKEVGVCGTAYKKIGKLSKYKKVYHPTEHKDIEALLLFNCPIHHPSAMIRKSILDEFNISYDAQFISLNDRKLYWELSKKTQLHNIPEVLYEYRIHSTMTSRVKRPEIKKEQLNYRMSLLEAYGIRLNEEELNILNAYILNGRCVINSNEILKQINIILEKLVSANQCNKFVDEIAFKKVCARYLIKRCKNAALKGFVSSKTVLANTILPVKCPWWLNVLNLIAREMKTLAVHLHVYYTEQLPSILKYLKHLEGVDYDLFVTMVKVAEGVEEQIKSFNNKAKIWVVENRGYDIGPFIDFLHKINLDDYKYVLKLHTKGSKSNNYTLLNNKRLDNALWGKDIMG